jgi:large subunit ribosomal protein L3
MVTGIIGRKIGMTQVFAPDGTVTPATVVKAGPCVVLQAKGTQTDGYEAVQLGLVEDKPIKVNKALGGHYKKAGNVPPTRMRREVKSAPGPADEAPLKAGDQVLVGGVFNDGDRIDVIGISRGKGFQGVMKRHNFAGGAATHGSMFHRAPGSIGASSFPSRVVKGMRAAGRMGGDRVTVRNLRIVKVDGENNLLLIRGAVPGSPGTYLIVRKAITAKKEVVPQVEKAGKVVVKKPAAKPAAKGKK